MYLSRARISLISPPQVYKLTLDEVAITTEHVPFVKLNFGGKIYKRIS